MDRGGFRPGDPVPWLLASEEPAIRWRTMVDLLGRPERDPEVRAVQAAIPAHPPLAALLAAQKADGYWIKRDYYLPKYDGTFWTLCMLGDMGLTAGTKGIRRGCEFMFTFQRESGTFCRRRRVAGKGIVWDENPGPCTHARIVRFLMQFGYGDDPRTRAGIAWLLANQRQDGTWDCGPAHRPGCLRATHDVLRVAALDPATAAQPAIACAVGAVCELLMEPGMSRYHSGTPWTVLAYPYFNCTLISTLEALARLGCTAVQPKIAAALEYLHSRQLPDGAWPLDERPARLPLDVGQPGRPNPWLTLDALRVIKALNGSD